MALVNYNAAQAIAVALLDEVVSGDARRVPHDVIEKAAYAVNAEEIRVSAILQLLIEQGSIRLGEDQRGAYLTAINPRMTQLRAMADVWRGKFPKKNFG